MNHRFGPSARLSLDGMLTLHGFSVAPSLRLDESNSVGFEFPPPPNTVADEVDGKKSRQR